MSLRGRVEGVGEYGAHDPSLACRSTAGPAPLALIFSAALDSTNRSESTINASLEGSSSPTTEQDHHRSREPPSRTDTPTIDCIQLNAYLLHDRRKRSVYQ